jgi:hypothetical protein
MGPLRGPGPGAALKGCLGGAGGDHPRSRAGPGTDGSHQQRPAGPAPEGPEGPKRGLEGTWLTWPRPAAPDHLISAGFP